jgi:hypothetical protein
MGYVEKVMGDNEQAMYRTHHHFIVLFERILGWLFAFLVFFGLGLAVLVPEIGPQGDRVRFIVGLIALGSLVMPLYLIAAEWRRGPRGTDFLKQIWQFIVGGILILGIAVVMMTHPEIQSMGWIAVAIALVPLFEMIRVFLDWLNERYIITNRRVMEVAGIINKHVRDSALEKVNDVDLKQSVIGRVLGYGTVQIITGSDIGVNRFYRISNPVRFKREMLNAKEHLQGGEPAEEPATASTPASTQGAEIPDLIAELGELRQKGIITEEEFQAKKKELLDRL